MYTLAPVAVAADHWARCLHIDRVAALKSASWQLRINRRDAKREDPGSPLQADRNRRRRAARFNQRNLSGEARSRE